MKLVICTKFQVNRMNCVESRRGVRLTPPPTPSRLRVAIFSSRVLGLTVYQFFEKPKKMILITKKKGKKLRKVESVGFVIDFLKKIG